MGKRLPCARGNGARCKMKLRRLPYKPARCEELPKELTMKLKVDDSTGVTLSLNRPKKKGHNTLHTHFHYLRSRFAFFREMWWYFRNLK